MPTLIPLTLPAITGQAADPDRPAGSPVRPAIERFERRPDRLPAGGHRITIIVAGSKPAASKGRFINITGFEVMP